MVGFSRKEWGSLIISILVMALALGFDDGAETFEWGFWLYNLIVVIGIVAFSFLVHQFAHKLAARAAGFQAEYSVWGIQGLKPWTSSITRLSKGEKSFPRHVNFLGKKYLVNSIPIGIIISVLVTLFSNGVLFFLAVGQYNLYVKSGSRVGKKFVQVTDFEEATISLVGPMSHIVLMLLASFFNTYGTFDTFIFINAAMAIFYMLPIHNLDGTKIFMGSPALYITSLVFMVASVILVYFLPIIPLLIVTGAAAVIAGSLFYFFFYVRGT